MNLALYRVMSLEVMNSLTFVKVQLTLKRKLN